MPVFRKLIGLLSNWYPVALLRKRRGDLVREIRGVMADRAEMRASLAVGSPGWLIDRERRYAPSRDRGRGATSPYSAKSRLLNSGGDKMSFGRNGYAGAYAEILQPWVGSASTVAELGVFMGSSLAVWCDLFPDGRVLGLDIELERFHRNLPRLRARGAFSSLSPEVLLFDAYRPDVSGLRDALGANPIDVFIDDGPHEIPAQIAVARAVRPLLAPRSLYIVEDTGGEVPDGLEAVFPPRSIDIVDRLVVVRLGDETS